ncbi:MAG: tRNA (cytidine(34)-2'-O)-methyltransferase [Alphaproteobacteria bacterium]
MRIALYEPDIPQNVGAVLRLGACLGVAVDIVEPCGFVFDDRRLRRAGMDYIPRATIRRHACWQDFVAGHAIGGGRLVLLTTAADSTSHDFRFAPDDTLVFGRESAGVPPAVHEAAAARLRIPMVPGARSLNVALAAAMVLGEAMRQTGLLPKNR